MKRTTSSLNRAHSRSSFDRLLFESEHSNGGGHSDRGLLFRLCQLVVIALRLITPFSYVYLVIFFTYGIKADSVLANFFFLFLTAWMFAEAIFFPYYYHLFNKLNNMKPELDHFASTPSCRKRLVRNCFNAMKIAASPESSMRTEPELYIRKVFEGWFLNVPLVRVLHGNMASWCGWAFFGKDVKEMTAEEREENNDIVKYIGEQAKWTFEPGFTEDLFSARLTLDPLFATQRPFLFYGAIWGVNSTCHVVLRAMGYKQRKEFSSTSQTIYFRPGSNRKGGNPIGHPIVFVHGIGIGFAHYLAHISTFPSEVDVYLVEWPHVAMQFSASAPTIESSTHAVISILEADKHQQACFVAHSLGTTLVSWMLHHPQGCKRVASTLLLDPVTFLLCDPTLATTFVYNDPTTPVDFLMHFFLSRELFIANALSRHFNWSHNIVFVEDLSATDAMDVHAYTPSTDNKARARSSSKKDVGSGKGVANRRESSPETVQQLLLNHTIILSSHDRIVPVAQVSRYLDAKARQGHTCFEVLMFHGQHGEMFLYPKWIRLLAGKVRDRCGLPPN